MANPGSSHTAAPAGRAMVALLALAAIASALVWIARLPVTEHQRTTDGAAADADSWFMLQRSYPTGRAASADGLDRAMRTVGPRLNLQPQLTIPGERWVSIGPRPIFVQNSLPYAGRVTAIAPHPTNADTLYIGTDSGGVWKTANGGSTWTSLTDAVPVPSIASLAIDPVNPQLLYATTIHRTYPTRLLRSTDGGLTWDVSSITLASGETLSPAPCSVNVFKACIPPSSGKVFIDPRRAGSPNTSTIYVAGSSHLFRSDDSGRTFRSLLSLPTDLDFGGADVPTRNPEAQFLRDAVVDINRPDRLFVAVAQPHCLDSSCSRADSAISIYRSFDAGGHWDRQDVGALAAYSLANTRYADPGAVYVPRVRVAIAPSSPDTIAVAVRDESIGRPRVFRSANAGDQWAETSLPPASSLTWPLGLVFSPSDASTIYLGSNSLYRTTNGGQSWTALGSTHADNIVLTFNASGVLVVGNDGGIFIATTGVAFAALHGSLPITEFYSVAAHPSNGLLIAGGTQDNGTALFQGNLGWSLVVGGDGGDVAFDPNPQATTLYAEVEWYFSGGANVFEFFRCQSGGCLARSSGIDKTVAGPFIPRMAMDPSESSTLWLTAERLFRTDNRGDSWTTASPSVASAERCWTDPLAGLSCASARYFTAVAVAPTASQTVYGGTLNGDVWMTSNRGATWKSVAAPNAGALPVRAVNDVVVDPLDARTVYVAYSGFDANGSGLGHLFRTTDAGQTWQNLSANLPDMPVNTVLIDPDSVGTSSARVLYVGTDIGVFRATLGANVNWQPFGTGLPPVVVNRLAYNATTHQLLAATYGRGVWAISSRFTGPATLGTIRMGR
jgi:photosystem II stability/assembly factor-like uncharacterized protein